MLDGKVLNTKEKFVELLTHNSVIVQTPWINTASEPKTELEKLLSVFEQKNFLDDDQSTINYNYSYSDDWLKKMIDVLHYISSDPERRAELDNEAYWHREFENTTGRLLKMEDENKELKNALADKDVEIERLKALLPK
jgi:hypothetical protein